MCKKIFSLLLLFVAMACQAQTATQIFDKTVSAFRNAGTVSASYSMRGSHGTIVMQGSKFRILANNVKAWYDGKTEYTYSKATGEVNITTPSARDLVMVSPLSVAGQVRNAYTMKAKKNTGGYTLYLTPKKKGQVKSITLYISKAYVLTKAVYTTNKGSQSLTISNYRTHVAASASTFRFSKSQVPAGTQVVDLR